METSTTTPQTLPPECERVIALKNKIEVGFLEIGKLLQKIRDEQLFKPQWSDFTEYLWEVKFSESTASKLINIYQKFVVDYEIPEERIAQAGGWSVLAEVLPLATTKSRALELLEASTGMPRHHLRKHIKELKTGVDMSTCNHAGYKTIILATCPLCGEQWRIYDEEKKTLAN